MSTFRLGSRARKALNSTVAPVASLALAFVTMVVAATDVAAADLFRVRVSTGGETQTRGFSSAEDALRQIEGQTVQAFFPGYRDTDAVDVDIDFRGLPIRGRFDNESRMLVFEVPSLDIVRTFGGATRDDSVNAFVDFIKKDGAAILNRIQRTLARVSSVDPVAGNPTSLQSELVGEAFESGGFRQWNTIGLVMSGGTFKAGDFTGRNLTLPLSYTFGFDEGDPRMKLQFKLPLTWQQVEGASIYAAAPSVAFTVPVTTGWALTPGVSYAATGSVEAASVAQMVGGSLTSDYRITDFPRSGATLAVTNLVGHVRTLPFSFRGYGFDPGLRNTILKNGVSLEHPLGVTLFGDGDLVAQASYAHSWFLGTDLFMKQYHELAVSLGAPFEELEAVADELRFGVTWTFGKDYNGFAVNFGYEF